jgi:hypothetical protein
MTFVPGWPRSKISNPLNPGELAWLDHAAAECMYICVDSVAGSVHKSVSAYVVLNEIAAGFFYSFGWYSSLLFCYF